ncbi:hypothetical protein [Mucilaginibacter sp.]|uniref:hypothetical protein n=1 Tax=Mucilaginibacter sp. TaxID=1882438 RepID=UPI002613590B|nr:hypothetical protein [Mucilaginibacter sp.]MDB4924416.1 hypothetical protein [Mucilaginibacter sp.]
MKKLLCFSYILFLAFNVFSQKLPPLLNNDTSKYVYPPVILLYSPNKPVVKLFSPETFNSIDPNNIDSIRIYGKPESVSLYGPDGQNGAIVIYTKTKVQLAKTDLYNINDITRVYSLKAKNIPVYIDSILVTHPDRVYLSPGKIISAKIYKDGFSGTEYINIITLRDKQEVPKNGEIWIRGLPGR